MSQKACKYYNGKKTIKFGLNPLKQRVLCACSGNVVVKRVFVVLLEL